MKDRIIALIIRDRTRVLTLLVSGAIAGSGALSVKFFNSELTMEHQMTITLIVTLIFGWLIEGYASDRNSDGAQQVQQALQIKHPEIATDGYMGPQTVAAAQDMAVDNMMREKR